MVMGIAVEAARCWERTVIWGLRSLTCDSTVGEVLCWTSSMLTEDNVVECMMAGSTWRRKLKRVARLERKTWSHLALSNETPAVAEE